MNSQENRDRLAREVKAARLRKFKTVDRARIAANVSRGTWDNVERGDSVKEFSLAAIEEALDWPPGTALDILRGGGADSGPAGERPPGRLAGLLEDYFAEHPGVSEATIAGQVGVSRATIRRWRTVALTELPAAESLRRLAAALELADQEVFYAAGVDAGYIIEHEVDDDPGLDLAAGFESGRLAARRRGK